MLTPEACLSDCDDDLLNVWVELGNTGAGPLLAGATIDVYGAVMGVESLLFSVDVPLALQPGEFADAFSIPVDLTDLEQIRLVAAPKETECKIDMANEIVIVPPFCTNPGQAAILDRPASACAWTSTPRCCGPSGERSAAHGHGIRRRSGPRPRVSIVRARRPHAP